MERRRLAALAAALEAVVLAGQLGTLLTPFWTSWDLRFNWTQGSLGGPDGQLVFQGHAGLWSRCVTLSRSGPDLNVTTSVSCLFNFDQEQPYTFGKSCKAATAGLCVVQAVLTATLAALLLAALRWPPLDKLHLPLLLAQGAILSTVPLLYVSGNMAELIHHLSKTYGLLLVVDMKAEYVHDWSFWLQVGLSLVPVTLRQGAQAALWPVWAGVLTAVFYRRPLRRASRPTSPEMEALRAHKR